MSETVQLRVVSLPSDEAGRGIVRIDPKVMERLGVSSGDIIEIKGKKKQLVLEHGEASLSMRVPEKSLWMVLFAAILVLE
jgi:formylmethanofuran dehydrogenase subunit D